MPGKLLPYPQTRHLHPVGTPMCPARTQWLQRKSRLPVNHGVKRIEWCLKKDCTPCRCSLLTLGNCFECWGWCLVSLQAGETRSSSIILSKTIRGNTLASHLWGRGLVPGMASSGKAGSCLPLVGSLQYTTLANYMYWFPLPFQLPIVIWPVQCWKRRKTPNK